MNNHPSRRRYQFQCTDCDNEWTSFRESTQCRQCNNKFEGKLIQSTPGETSSDKSDLDNFPPLGSISPTPKTSKWVAKTADTLSEQLETGLTLDTPLPEVPEITPESPPTIENLTDSGRYHSLKPPSSPVSPSYQQTSDFKVYQFNAFYGSQQFPGFAVAIAESLEEAIDRIVFKFSQNLTLILQRQSRYQYLLSLLKDNGKPLGPDTPHETVVRLAAEQLGYGPREYNDFLGPCPEDYCGRAWMYQMPADQALDRLRTELALSSYYTYPIQEFALYSIPEF